MSVTRAGLGGWQEHLGMQRDLILKFHIPEILLIRKLLVLSADPLYYGKHPRCQREEEALGEHTTSVVSQMLVGEAYQRE